MAKTKTIFTCQNCGAQFPKWQGQCAECGTWSSLVEETQVSPKKSGSTLSSGASARPGQVVSLKSLSGKKAQSFTRTATGSAELDRVLGGGIVPGSVVLVGGEPGIGKSTLLTQLALQLVGQDKQVLYVAGEESPEQIALRVQRLGHQTKTSNTGDMSFLPQTDVDVIIATAGDTKPDLMIVDSIQTLQTTNLSGMAGSVGQIRESGNRLISFAKRTNTAVFIVGHVTKEGSIAGPKVLEHMVDAVLQMTGERTGLWRLLKAHKNRFGTTDEVGVFAMDTVGLVDVANPSGAFLEEASASSPGSAIIPIMEGTRPVLIEVQALAVTSHLAMPRRVAHGISLSKLQVIAAVLTKHCRLKLDNYDLFVNIAGGLKISEPAADLGIALAIASSVAGTSLAPGTVCIGELGLLGQIRRVNFLESRVSESAKLGYQNAITPKTDLSLAKLVKKLFK